jgi:hypothetical protein
MRSPLDLWRELRSLLQARGDLPLEYEVLTPAEIAQSVRRTNGDERPQRFVWSYYYPRHYGAAAADDAAAAALVGSFEERPEPPPLAAAASAQASSASCGVCHRRPARGEAPK